MDKKQFFDYRTHHKLSKLRIRKRRRKTPYRGVVNQPEFPNQPEPQKRPEKMFNTGIPGTGREDMDAILNRDRT